MLRFENGLLSGLTITSTFLRKIFSEKLLSNKKGTFGIFIRSHQIKGCSEHFFIVQNMSNKQKHFAFSTKVFIFYLKKIKFFIDL